MRREVSRFSKSTSGMCDCNEKVAVSSYNNEKISSQELQHQNTEEEQPVKMDKNFRKKEQKCGILRSIWGLHK